MASSVWTGGKGRVTRWVAQPVKASERSRRMRAKGTGIFGCGGLAFMGVGWI